MLDFLKYKFRWHPIVVNGQDVNQLLAAFKEASETKDKPTCIIAKTFKDSISGVHLL